MSEDIVGSQAFLASGNESIMVKSLEIVELKRSPLITSVEGINQSFFTANDDVLPDTAGPKSDSVLHEIISFGISGLDSLVNTGEISSAFPLVDVVLHHVDIPAHPMLPKSSKKTSKSAHYSPLDTSEHPFDAMPKSWSSLFATKLCNMGVFSPRTLI